MGSMYEKLNKVSSTCLALWAVLMPWFLRQLTALGSGDRPTFQSETAPLSMTHCNIKHTSALSRSSTVPAGQRDSWGYHASSCKPAPDNQEGFLVHTWMSLHCLSSNYLKCFDQLQFPENCFCDGWLTVVTQTREQHRLGHLLSHLPVRAKATTVIFKALVVLHDVTSRCVADYTEFPSASLKLMINFGC